jgi:multicomponent Na+:H+ antiporter subunit E
VLSPGLPISPTVAEFDAHCEHPVDRAILGNSITLTPGTLTLSIDGQRFVVHALTEDGARDIIGGEMDRRVSLLRSP